MQEIKELLKRCNSLCTTHEYIFSCSDKDPSLKIYKRALPTYQEIEMIYKTDDEVLAQIYAATLLANLKKGLGK